MGEWVAQVRRVQQAEGWNEARARLSAVRRLKGTALEWNTAVGENIVEFVAWRTSLTNSFRRRLTASQFGVLIESRVQRPGEPGMIYALEKAKLCSKSLMPLGNTEVVRHLINGLARWEQVALILKHPPTDLAEFIERIRDLEDIGVTPSSDVAPTSPPPPFSYAPPNLTPHPTQTMMQLMPTTVSSPSTVEFVAAFGAITKQLKKNGNKGLEPRRALTITASLSVPTEEPRLLNRCKPLRTSVLRMWGSRSHCQVLSREASGKRSDEARPAVISCDVKNHKGLVPITDVSLLGIGEVRGVDRHRDQCVCRV